jgi:hypothetical protein
VNVNGEVATGMYTFNGCLWPAAHRIASHKARGKLFFPACSRYIKGPWTDVIFATFTGLISSFDRFPT